MRVRSFSLLRNTVAAFALACLAGCGNSDGRLKVTGSLKYEDGSVPKGATPAVLRFEPEDPNQPNVRPATGYVNAETGEFDLYCIKPGDGAYPGKYKVVVRVDNSYPPKPNNASIATPLEYLNAESTPLSAEISSANRHFEFKVPKRSAKSAGKKGRS